jgi:predicted glutamine amidotransferase
MCGIFAYTGITPKADVLTAAALEAGRRGPHGHGWIARQADGSYREHRQLGALNGDVGLLTSGPPPRAVLGHARLATVGDWADINQLQPITVDGHAVAHNGTVYNSPTLGSALLPTDSAALAFQYAMGREQGHAPAAALARVLEIAEQVSWAIVILDRDGQLIAHRHRHPLYQLRIPWGVYLSSRPFADGCQLLPEDKITVITGEEVSGGHGRDQARLAEPAPPRSLRERVHPRAGADS